MYKCLCTTYPYETHFVLKKSNRVSLSVTSHPNLSSNIHSELQVFQRIFSDKYAYWSSPRGGGHSGGEKVFYFKFFSMRLKICRLENQTQQICVLFVLNNYPAFHSACIIPTEGCTMDCSYTEILFAGYKRRQIVLQPGAAKGNFLFGSVTQ